MNIKFTTLFCLLLFGSVTSAQQKADKVNQKRVGRIAVENLPAAQKPERGAPTETRNLFANNPLQFQPLVNPSVKRGLPDGFRIDAMAENGLPLQIRGTLKNLTGELSKQAISYLSALNQVMRIQNPAAEFARLDAWTDEFAQQHLKMQQQFRGVKVFDAQLILHEKNNHIYLLNGRWFPTPNLASVEPILRGGDAEQLVRQHLEQNGEKWQTAQMLDPNNLGILKNLEQLRSELVIYHVGGRLDGERLVWHIKARPHLLSMWEYFVDASTGEILNKYTNLCNIGIDGRHICNHPEHQHNTPKTGFGRRLKVAEKEAEITFDGNAVANATDSRGITRTFNTYQVGSRYYLLDATRPMFNNAQSSMPNNPVGAILTLTAQNTSPENRNFQYDLVGSNNNSWSDVTAVSGHYNSSKAYDYFRTTFNRNSINGRGGNIVSLVNVAERNGRGMDNAFWDGEAMYYGNGDQAFFPLARGLDVAGHEMSHGVVQNTANLRYEGESGALNESFADIFGAMIDRDDWLIGEDVVRTSYFPSGALRSLQDPHNGGTRLSDAGYQPRTYAERYTGSDDNGGVHINSGIPNYAFYLFATNSSVGKERAEQVFHRALTNYLVASSKFIDLRNGVMNAIGDLYPNSPNIVTAANNAFNTVGIGGNTTPGGTTNNYQNELPVNQGADWVLFSAVDSSSLSLLRISDGSTFRISTTKHISKPSISDDGSEVVFVGTDNKIHYIPINWTTLTVGSETVFSAWGNEWSSVVISKDGQKLAATSIYIDTAIYIYSDRYQHWRSYKLRNPTTSQQGNSVGSVVFADALEWDHAGEYVMYDAYNRLRGANNQELDYWDVGFLRAWSLTGNIWGDGKIEKLFTGLPTETSVGNPTFAKNSPYIVAFDWIDNTDSRSTIYHVWGANIQSGDYDTIFVNNTLGYPAYARLDNKLIFNYKGQTSLLVAQQEVVSNKIRGSSNPATILRSPAQWGTWFGIQNRRLATQDLGDGSKISIFPNPFNEILQVEIDALVGGEGKIEVFDMMGKIVTTTPLSIALGKQQISLDLSHITVGTYFVRTTIGARSSVDKLLKIK